jgi:hypothetical protein
MNYDVDKSIRKKFLISGALWYAFNEFVLPNRNDLDMKQKLIDSSLFAFTSIVPTIFYDKFGIKRKADGFFDYINGYLLYLGSQYYLKTNSRSLETNAKFSVLVSIL